MYLFSRKTTVYYLLGSVGYSITFSFYLQQRLIDFMLKTLNRQTIIFNVLHNKKKISHF